MFRFLKYLILFVPALVCSQVYLTKEEALKVHFPHARSVDRKSIFLSDEQVENIQTRAKAKVESKIVTYYVGRDESSVLGYAFFDTRTIRTMPATYVVVVSPDSSIRAVEILAFYEPEDYVPSRKWLAQFTDKTLENDLWLKRGIHNIVGATLSAQALSEAVRRILATFEIAVPKEQAQ